MEQLDHAAPAAALALICTLLPVKYRAASAAATSAAGISAAMSGRKNIYIQKEEEKNVFFLVEMLDPGREASIFKQRNIIIPELGFFLNCL